MTNNVFGTGLPPETGSQAALMGPLLGNPANRSDRAAMRQASEMHLIFCGCGQARSYSPEEPEI